jgi:hypothetical protein
VLREALRDPIWDGDSYVAGPLAVAQVELGWLTGTIDRVPPAVSTAVQLATESGHTAIQGELTVYLRRAGHAVPAPAGVSGPWALSLAGRWREAAAAWQELGERYEEAVELAWSGDDQARAAGLRVLTGVRATATVARVLARERRLGAHPVRSRRGGLTR